LDMERSRSFGIVTEDPVWVEEAVKLFTADSTRQQYVPTVDTFIVSPGNSRRQITAFIAAAEHELLLYDGKLTDLDIIRLLQCKAREGVDIRIIGQAARRASALKIAPLATMRLHGQAIVRDGKQVFVGSQSLRSLELDARREVGVLIDDPEVV